MPQANLGYSEQPIHGMYFRTMRDNGRAFDAIAAFRSKPFNLGSSGAPERLDGAEATGEFFEAIGVSAANGRTFTRANEEHGRDHVVVISDALWRRRFGGDRNTIGHVIDLNAEPYTIIGIAPRGFSFPRGAEMPADFQFPSRTDVWVPLRPPENGPSDLAVVARLRPRISLEAARADLRSLEDVENRLLPSGKGSWGTQLTPLRTQLVGKIEPMLVSLLASVGLLLAIACVNTAQLQVAQLQRRRRELAIRSALGASARRVMAGLTADVAIVTCVAGTIGIALAWMGLGVVRSYASTYLPRLGDASFDVRTALASVGMTALAAALAGALPMWFVAHIPVVESLRRGERGLGGSARTRRILIVAELSLSVVLVASAGLLSRSLGRQLRGALGFSAPNGLTFEVTLPPVRYAERQFRTYMEHPDAVMFITAALDRIRALPGVQSAAIGKPLPLSGAQEASIFIAEGASPPATPAETPIAEYTVASGQMFAALGTSMLAGRDFAGSDVESAPPVVIVNQAMAKWLWPGQSAIGKRIHLGTYRMSPPWMTVIGVVADLKRYSLTESARPEMIVPYTQKPYPSFSTMQFVVRASIPVAEVLSEVRQAVAAVDPTIPISRVRSIEDLVSEASATARFAAEFMLAFGACALVLTMVGLYGVIAFSVQQRRHEFGVRRALGAAPMEVVRQVLREGGRLAAIGVVLGGALAIGAGRALRQLLYQTSDHDPQTLIVTLLVLGLATVSACLLPAWRASRVEPRVALEEA
ncbi:MAG: ABC transporter permease [Gemmatimonadaceae bacterium]